MAVIGAISSLAHAQMVIEVQPATQETVADAKPATPPAAPAATVKMSPLDFFGNAFRTPPSQVTPSVVPPAPASAVDAESDEAAPQAPAIPAVAENSETHADAKVPGSDEEGQI